jgi:hypothetical protein
MDECLGLAAEVGKMPGQASGQESRWPGPVVLPFCLFAFLPFCLSAFLPFCLSAFLPFCLSAF